MKPDLNIAGTEAYDQPVPLPDSHRADDPELSVGPYVDKIIDRIFLREPCIAPRDLRMIVTMREELLQALAAQEEEGGMDEF